MARMGLQRTGDAPDLRVSQLIKYRNSRPKDALHPTKDRIMRRQRNTTDSNVVLPTYRLSGASRELLVAALAEWWDEQKRRATAYVDKPAWLKDAQLELADIKAIAGTVPRVPPYDMHLTSSETDVAHRALRWLHKVSGQRAPLNLYLHWVAKRGTEYKLGKRFGHDQR